MWVQLTLLLGLCVVHLLYLRLLVPWRLPADQVCEVASAAADIAAVTCGFLLLHDPAAAFRCCNSLNRLNAL